MGGKVFLDTNLFVYANDRRDPERQRTAIEAVKEMLASSRGVVSTQVLMEYAAVAVAKLRQERSAVTRQLLAMERFEVLAADGQLIRSALELMAAYALSFWDAAIVASAQAAHCDELWSEDFGAGSRFGAVTVRNPLAPSQHETSPTVSR